MWNQKRNDTNELPHRTEIDSLTLKTNLHRQRGRDSEGLWEGHVHTAVFKMDNQQRPIVQHMELSSGLCASLWEGGLGEKGYMYMYG